MLFVFENTILVNELRHEKRQISLQLKIKNPHKSIDLQGFLFYQMCPGRDLNPHAENRHHPLKVACLPISPPGQTRKTAQR